MFNGKIYVPRDRQLRHDIMKHHHRCSHGKKDPQENKKIRKRQGVEPRNRENPVPASVIQGERLPPPSRVNLALSIQPHVLETCRDDKP